MKYLPALFFALYSWLPPLFALVYVRKVLLVMMVYLAFAVFYTIGLILWIGYEKINGREL